MNRKGILFQGLPVYEALETDVIREESFYGLPLAVQERGKQDGDVTYFLLYAMCKNVICRGKVRSMKQERKEYLLKQAEKSSYQGEYFWLCLDLSEQKCAKLVLGLLEDIRKRTDDRAEKSWVSLWYLIRSSFREEYSFLQTNRNISCRELCRKIGRGEDRQFMGISRVCMAYLAAEDLQIKIRKDEKYSLLCTCVKTGTELWDCSLSKANRR